MRQRHVEGERAYGNAVKLWPKKHIQYASVTKNLEKNLKFVQGSRGRRSSFIRCARWFAYVSSNLDIKPTA